MQKTAILDLTYDELEAFLTPLGVPAFRAKQVFGWLWREMVSDFMQMTNVPKALRDKLGEIAYIDSADTLAEVEADDKMTRKCLSSLRDGVRVESVLMRYPAHAASRARNTVCISSQAGCAMSCTFCATGQEGLVRNLSSGEIAAQVLHFARELRTQAAGVTNVVVMGQGEPLANYDALLGAIRSLNSPYGFGLGARHFTISTVGLVPRIRDLACSELQVGLAISLHAPDDELRSQLLPINRRYPLADLLAACREYVALTHRRITFEYALIDGLNDSLNQSRELATLLGKLLCHVNLIPLNDVQNVPLRPSKPQQVLVFQEELTRRGILVTMRAKRGGHIEAACGQLRARVKAVEFPRPLKEGEG